MVEVICTFATKHLLNSFIFDIPVNAHYVIEYIYLLPDLSYMCWCELHLPWGKIRITGSKLSACFKIVTLVVFTILIWGCWLNEAETQEMKKVNNWKFYCYLHLLCTWLVCADVYVIGLQTWNILRFTAITQKLADLIMVVCCYKLTSHLNLV